MIVNDLIEFLNTMPGECGVFIAYPNLKGDVSFVHPHILVEMDPAEPHQPLIVSLATAEAVAMTYGMYNPEVT